VDELATFGICLPISFTGKKVYARRDFGMKVSSSMGPNIQLSNFGRAEVV
jgi:hypothetical protein